MRYCLDAWPVVGWMRNEEPIASRVDAILSQRPLMSWINVGEVLYVTERRAGPAAVPQTVEMLKQQFTLDPPTEERFIAAAALKASHKLSYADAFAVATAIALRRRPPDRRSGDTGR